MSEAFVDLLLEMLELRRPVVSASLAEETDSVALAQLMGAGVLVPAGREPYSSDDDGRPVPLQWNPDDQGWRYFDRSAGWVDVPASDGARIAVNPRALLRQLFENAAPTRIQEAASGVVWRMDGLSIAGPQGTVTGWFVRRAADPSVWSQFKTEIAARPTLKRLLFTSTPKNLLPNDSGFGESVFSLRDVLVSGALQVDLDRVVLRRDQSSSATPGPLEVSDEGCRVRLHDRVFRFRRGTRQQAIIWYLWQRHRAGIREVPWSEVVRALGLRPQSRAKEYFKGNPAGTELLDLSGGLCRFRVG